MNTGPGAHVALLVAAAILAGCASPATEPRATRAVPVTAEDVAGLTYTGILDEPVTLVDGAWEGEPYVAGSAARPRVTLSRELVRNGDLDGDGTEDAAAIITATGGGSGAFVHLAFVSGAGGAPANAGTVLLGDRVDIRSFDIDAGHARLRLLEAGPDDPACCPMQEVLLIFGMVDGQLQQLGRIEMGRLSASSLAGTTWRLTHFDIGEAAPAEPPVSLQINADGQFAGDSGCNRYMGRMAIGEAGQLELGPVASTQRMCPADVMQVEDRYLQRIGGLRQIGFFNARLALTWQAGEDAGVLLFEPDEAGDE
jgi:heat shock protein HslJ